jgi:hypothetical protein
MGVCIHPYNKAMIAELYYRYSKLDKQKQFALLADNEQG